MAALSLAMLSACAAEDTALQDDQPFTPAYLGAAAEALDSDLIRITVEMRGARDDRDVRAYADCAMAGYADARGFGFARHLRTSVADTSGVWAADAIYTMSATIPEGFRTLEAEVVIAQCNETGIPLV